MIRVQPAFNSTDTFVSSVPYAATPPSIVWATRRPASLNTININLHDRPTLPLGRAASHHGVRLGDHREIRSGEAAMHLSNLSSSRDVAAGAPAASASWKSWWRSWSRPSGLLGLAKMEALAISSTSVASSRSLAAIEASSLAAAMHANPGYWAAGIAPPSIVITAGTPYPLVTSCFNVAGRGSCTPGEHDGLRLESVVDRAQRRCCRALSPPSTARNPPPTPR